MAGLGLTKEINDPETKDQCWKERLQRFSTVLDSAQTIEAPTVSLVAGGWILCHRPFGYEGKTALHAQENIEDLAQFVVPFRLVLYRLRAQNEHRLDEQEGDACPMDEGRKRVIGIMAAILASRRTETADGLFRTPQGRPRTDEMIAATIRWAKKIMEKMDYDRGVNQVRAFAFCASYR